MARNKAQFRKGISRMELACHLGIPYNAARRVKRNPMQAMLERDRQYKLSGLIELLFDLLLIRYEIGSEQCKCITIKTATCP